MLEIVAKFEIVIHVKHSLRTVGTARVFQKQGSSADTLEAREKKIKGAIKDKILGSIRSFEDSCTCL